MTAHESHKIDFKYLGLFLGTAVFVGFALGTLTLLGPVRWTVATLRSRGLGEGSESTVVVIYMLVLLLVTLIASSAIATYFESEAPRWKRFLLAAATVAVAVVANFFWTSPTLMKKNMGVEEQLAMFTFGPYPDEAKLRELKARGFTGVISLLHPAVVPFEPQLLSDERAAASRVGIEFIHAPMLPWVSDNRESVAKVRQLAGNRQNRYYVHCYLGMDRVMIVKRIVEQEAGTTTAVIQGKTREPLGTRTFERGKVIKVSDTLYVGPHPTPEELAEIVAGHVENVVSLADGDKPRTRLLELSSALVTFRIKHVLVELSTVPFDADATLRAVSQVRAMTGVTYVHDYYGPGTRRAPLAEAFLVAYQTGRPPVMPLIADVPLEGGAMKLLDVDVVSGPRPRKLEFVARLAESGVRVFVCLGGPSAECTADEKLCERDGLKLVAAGDVSDVVEIFRGTGPFYVYSPKAATPGKEVLRIAATRAAGRPQPIDTSQ